MLGTPFNWSNVLRGLTAGLNDLGGVSGLVGSLSGLDLGPRRPRRGGVPWPATCSTARSPRRPRRCCKGTSPGARWPATALSSLEQSALNGVLDSGVLQDVTSLLQQAVPEGLTNSPLVQTAVQFLQQAATGVLAGQGVGALLRGRPARCWTRPWPPTWAACLSASTWGRC